MTFAGTFTFARPNAAPYRAADGRTLVAAPGVPRFDHLSDGTALGLVVEAGSDMGQQDAVAVRPGAMAIVRGVKATVLHERMDVGGAIVRRAHYTLDATVTANACLAQLGRHRLLAVVEGFLPIRGAVVAYRGRRWSPPAVIVMADGTPISLRAGVQLLAG